MIYDAANYGDILAAVAAMADTGDAIRLTSDGPYVATADLIASKGFTLYNRRGIIPTIDFGRYYYAKFTSPTGGCTIHINDPVNFLSARPGNIWTPAWAAATHYTLGTFVSPTAANGFVYELTSLGGGLSSGTQPTWATSAGAVTPDTVDPNMKWTARLSVTAVMLVQALNGDCAFRMYGGSFDGGGIAERLLQVQSAGGPWVMTANVFGTAFDASADDNMNASDSSAGNVVENLCVATARDCEFRGSVHGDGLSAHYCAKSIMRGGSSSGHGLVPFGVGRRGRMEIYDATADHSAASAPVTVGPGATILLDGVTLNNRSHYPNCQCNEDGGGVGTTANSLIVRNSTFNKIGDATADNTATATTILFCSPISGKSSTVTLSDNHFNVIGDPRFGGVSAGINVVNSGVANVLIERNIIDYSAVAQAFGAAQHFFAFNQQTNAASALTLRGNVFMGMRFAQSIQHQFVRTTPGSSTPTYLYDNTFFNDRAANSAAWGWYTRNAALTAVGNIIVGCSTGIHADGNAANYPAACDWNFLDDCPTDFAGGAVQKTHDQKDITIGFVDRGTDFDLRIAAGGFGELIRTTGASAYQMDPAAVALAATHGSVARVPAVGGPFPIPVNVGAYASFAAQLALTATPASGYQFASWLGSLASSTGASAIAVMDAAKTIEALFIPLLGAMIPAARIAADIEYALKHDTRIIAASGVPTDQWPDHVFSGIADGFNGPRNRGRLPYIEYDLDTTTHVNATSNSVASAPVLKLRVRAAQNRNLDGYAVIDALTQYALLAIRTWYFNRAGLRSQSAVAGTAQQYDESSATTTAIVDDHASAMQDARMELHYWSDKGDMGTA